MHRRQATTETDGNIYIKRRMALKLGIVDLNGQRF
jgi:hypothetical protein